MEPSGPAAERTGLLAFAGCALLGGGNAVGVRFSNRELDPLWGASVRFGAAAVLLLLVMAVMRLALPRGRALAGAVLYGVLNFAVTFALAYYALVHIHAGLGQTLLALVPLVALLLAVAQRQERFRGLRWRARSSRPPGSRWPPGHRCRAMFRRCPCWRCWAPWCPSPRRPYSCTACRRSTR